LKKKIGFWVTPILFITTVILWLFWGPENNGSENFTSQLIAEIFASSAMVLMAYAMIIAARFRFLEPYFGGLDKMYVGHKMAAIPAMFLIVVHKLVAPESGDQGIGPKLGMVALLGMVILVILTILPRTPLKRVLKLPYHKWLTTHKFIGVFFIVGIIHTFLIDNLIKDAPIVSIYVRSIVFSGALAYLYKELGYKWLKKHYKYSIESITRLNHSTMEILFKPQEHTFRFKPGQFMFVNFHQNGLNEFHPFTISSAPNQDLRISIKACGDFTHKVYRELKEGTIATIDAPYGQFDYSKGKTEQIWIAGGIGITPFLSWINDASDNSFRVHFYHTIRDKSEALYLDEIKNMIALKPRITFIPYSSNEQGHLTAEKIKDEIGEVTGKEVYLCGPASMTHGLKRQFLGLGLPAKNIHFEEFTFR